VSLVSKHSARTLVCLIIGTVILNTTGSWATPKEESEPKTATSTSTPGKTAAPSKTGSPSKEKSTAKTRANPKAKEPAKNKAVSKLKKETEATEAVPWSLRDKYTFTNGKMVLMYAVESSELRLVVEGLSAIIDDAGFRITFADGSSVDAAALGKAETEREAFTSDLGAGTRFWTEYPAKDGLQVRHALHINKERPGMFVTLTLSNVGDKPLEIAKICPFIVGPSGIRGLSKEVSATARRFSFRGPFPVFDSKGPVSFNIFHDSTNQIGFTLGVLPMGISTANAEFRSTEPGVWRGEVSCVYDPPIRIEPGKKIESDPLWLTTNTSSAAKADLDYSWATSVKPHPDYGPDAPNAWITVDEGGGIDDLCKAVNSWSGAMIKHALIPGDWEGRPGSLQGSAPRYPKNMEKAAAQIDAMGMKPGITVDPLLTDEAGSAFAAASSDGRRWVNVSHPDGRKSAIERMKKVAGWGFQFFVVRFSDIPSEVLKQFNMTRTQANSTALAVMAEAAGSRPVFPSTSGSVGPTLDAWLEVAACSNRMAEFGVTPGPVRFVPGNRGGLDDAVVAAMLLFNGPIEFAGVPSGDLLKTLASSVPAERVMARPVDAASVTPRLWQVHLTGPNSEWLGDSIIAFAGSRAWSPKAIELDQEAKFWLWRAADGQAMDMNAPEIPAVDRLTLYGVSPVLPRPALMGASNGFDLLLGDLKSIAWNEEKGILSGSFLGHNREQAMAFVAIPPGWALESGKAGDSPVSKKNVTDRVQFPVKSGVSTPFELKFVRK